MRSILVVVSAADRWTLADGTVHPTGFWAEELAVPHRIFTRAGWDVTIATPGGTPPTLDRRSLGIAGGRARRRHAVAGYLDRIGDQLSTPVALDQVDPSGYDAVFYPGGHAPMEDLAYDATSGELLTRALASGRPVALLCHGPAAALAARNADGSWPFAGYRMTALSNAEERLNTFAWRARWLLEDRLRENGARFSKGLLPLRPHVVADRNLLTGQNPASALELATRLVQELGPPALSVVATRVIRAPREELHAFVSDMTRMGEISPETRSVHWVEPGHRFVGRNAIGIYRWPMGGVVTENVPGRTFAFLTDWPSESHWRYTFEPVDGGTLVTESMRKQRPQLRPIVLVQDAVGARDRQAHLRAGMETTLARLAERFEVH